MDDAGLVMDSVGDSGVIVSIVHMLLVPRNYILYSHITVYIYTVYFYRVFTQSIPTYRLLGIGYTHL